MTRTELISGTGVTRIATGTESFTGRVTVQIVVASGTPTFSANFRCRVSPTVQVLAGEPNSVASPPLDTNAPLLAYRDSSAAADTAGATAITAVGVFDVDCTNKDVALHVSALSGGTLGLIIGSSIIS